jgi:hypothetical protein
MYTLATEVLVMNPKVPVGGGLLLLGGGMECVVILVAGFAQCYHANTASWHTK